MYPNPQEALPLPARPRLAAYEQLAHDLAAACRSGDPAAIHAWAAHWIPALADTQGAPHALDTPSEIAAHIGRVDAFARQTLSGGDDAGTAGHPASGAADASADVRLPSASTCTLAAAQLVVARVHGFATWPIFVSQIQAFARVGARGADESEAAAGADVEAEVRTGAEVRAGAEGDAATEAEGDAAHAAFEDAASAIVAGDRETLARLLHEHPRLTGLRSLREHRATLLHYASANGIEGYRQVSPANIASLAEMLLAAGAEVDAEAEVYGGRCTALGLVATSAPPFHAGVQRALIDLLLDHGAQPDRPGIAGRNDTLIYACLANGQPDAAAHLASRGARIDLAGAAGLGRVDVLRRSFGAGGDVSADGDAGDVGEAAKAGDAVGTSGGAGTLDASVVPMQPPTPTTPATPTSTPTPTPAQIADAFALACGYGHADAVAFLLDRGVAADLPLAWHGEGHTGLHVAAYHGHTAVVSTLLQRGASVEAIDRTWGTPPLLWALTGWTGRRSAQAPQFYAVVALLVQAGARVTDETRDWDPVRADPQMLAALDGRAATA